MAVCAALYDQAQALPLALQVHTCDGVEHGKLFRARATEHALLEGKAFGELNLVPKSRADMSSYKRLCITASGGVSPGGAVTE